MILAYRDLLPLLRTMPRDGLRLTVLTSCTNVKAVNPAVRPLTWEELFGNKPDQLAKRSAELEPHQRIAERMYLGQQHTRLMRGVTAVRRTQRVALDLFIVSAGFGIVSGFQPLVPYNATFSGMSKRRIREHADQLLVPDSAMKLIRDDAHLKLVLLGDDYLEACRFTFDLPLPAPVVVLCSPGWAGRLPDVPNLHVVPLGNPEAKSFGLGLIGLKGELGAQLLELLAEERPMGGALASSS